MKRHPLIIGAVTLSLGGGGVAAMREFERRIGTAFRALSEWTPETLLALAEAAKDGERIVAARCRAEKEHGRGKYTFNLETMKAQPVGLFPLGS